MHSTDDGSSPARDSILVGRAVTSSHQGRARAPMWIHVKKAFSIGKTRAVELCNRFGVDPDEER